MAIEASTNSSLLEFIVLSQTKVLRPLNEGFKPELSPLQVNVVLLLKAFGSMTMTQLTEKLMMPKQQMTQIAHYLESIDFIERRTDEGDRRKIIVGLTEKADAYITRVIDGYMGGVMSGEGNLSTRDRKQLIAAIDTLNALLEKIAAR